MGIVFRQSIKTTIVTFIGALLGAFTLYFSAYVFKYNDQEFGFIRTLINVGAVTQVFIVVGTPPLIITYAQRFSEDLRKKVLITICSVVPVTAVILFLLPYFLLRVPITGQYKIQDQPYIAHYYAYVPLLILLWGYSSLFESYLSSQHKVAAATFMREIVLRLCNIAILILFFLKMITFEWLVILSVLIYAVPLAFLLWVASKTKGFGFSLKFNVLGKKEYREMAHFAWYHLLLGVPTLIMGFSDSIMLASLDPNGLAAVKVYTFAIFITALMTIPYRAMAGAAFPTLNQAYIDNDTPKINDLFHRSGINILIVAVAMFLIIGGNLPNAIAMLPAGKGYEAIKPLVLILMIGRLIDMGTGLNNELISISKLYKFNFRISVVLVALMVFLNWLWIPKYSFYGAAWASTIALAIFNIAKVIFLWVKMKLHPFTNKSYLVILAGGITAIVAFGLPYFSNLWIDILVRTSLVVVVYAALLIYLKPSSDLASYLGAVRKNKRLF